ncbi:MAG: TOBE domain-containing protein, partial [Alphaproteobacteria bacterium]
FKAGEKVALSLRPEAVHIDWMKSGQGENQFKTTVEYLTYLGESEQFLLKTKGGESLKVNFYHAPEHDFHVGSEVGCFISTINTE